MFHGFSFGPLRHRVDGWRSLTIAYVTEANPFRLTYRRPEVMSQFMSEGYLRYSGRHFSVLIEERDHARVEATPAGILFAVSNEPFAESSEST